MAFKALRFPMVRFHRASVDCSCCGLYLFVALLIPSPWSQPLLCSVQRIALFVSVYVVEAQWH